MIRAQSSRIRALYDIEDGIRGHPWALAGLWSDWTDPESGEVVLSFTVLTQNCDAHPVLKHTHKPDPSAPADQQDKRTIVPVERADWDQWLRGTIEDALELVRLPACELRHGPTDPASQVQLALV